MTTTPTPPTVTPPPPPTLAPFSASTDPARALPTFARVGPSRPAVPPGDTVRPYDGHAAALLDAVNEAESDAVAAALAWDRERAGGDARRADRDFVEDHLARTGELPAVTAGPLAEHPRQVEALYVTAVRAEVLADYRRSEVAAYVSTATDLHATLDDATNDLAARMAALLTEARDHRRHRAYDEAMTEVAPAWQTAARLYGWCRNPGTAWQTPTGRGYPAELEFLEWEAATALGQRRIGVPVEALARPGAPVPDGTRSIGRPTIPSEGTTVNGNPAGRGGWLRKWTS